LHPLESAAFSRRTPIADVGVETGVAYVLRAANPCRNQRQTKYIIRRESMTIMRRVLPADLCAGLILFSTALGAWPGKAAQSER
jgi:hypothetical protein